MDATKRTLFLRKVHLFHDLKDEQLLQVGEKFSEVSFDAGQMILEQGVLADSFYLLYSGKVRVYRRRDGREEELATLVSGDYFGEMALFEDQVRSATMDNITLVIPNPPRSKVTPIAE